MAQGRQVESVVWVCFVIALAASVYVLLHEPEDEPGAKIVQGLVQMRLVAVAASVLGAVCGVWRVLTRGADENLFSLAVLVCIILASFWLLRIAVVGHGVPPAV